MNIQPGLSAAAGELHRFRKVHFQLSPEQLTEDTLQRQQGVLSDTGALLVTTGEFTGRSPADRFIVKDEVTADIVDWNDINIPFKEENFLGLKRAMIAYLAEKEEVWARYAYTCPIPSHRLHLCVITESPWANLFAYNMFLRPTERGLHHFTPQWTIIQAPGFKASSRLHGTRKSNCTVISFKHKTILIAGTGYTGEIKKSIFSVLNFTFPYQKNVLSMHCSANVGKYGDAALFFGLSGTGKTALSADPQRRLIGDDEHGWSDQSVFNFEGGCYAKTIHLSEDNEPQLFNAIRKGALVENMLFKPGTNHIDFNNSSITENTRVSYPLSFIDNALEPSVGPTPRHVFFLACDALGILPPVSKLTSDQAMYYFISGYTAKIAGAEHGNGTPQPVFSACFGAPFLPLRPRVYAEMLGKKIKASHINVWLVNTGWTGGPYGIGTRIKLAHTRAMISAVLNEQMEDVPYDTHPVLGIQVPQQCPGVPSAILNPLATWADKAAYDQQAYKLADLFAKNFKKYSAGLSNEIIQAGPGVRK